MYMSWGTMAAFQVKSMTTYEQYVQDGSQRPKSILYLGYSCLNYPFKSKKPYDLEFSDKDFDKSQTCIMI